MSVSTRIGSKSRDGGAAFQTQIDLTTWVAIDEHALAEDQRELFLRRKQGIGLYLNGACATALKQACGLLRAEIYRLITQRCLKTHPDGELYGWRGALPYQRVKNYSRSSPLSVNNWGGGAVGAMQWLFESSSGQGLDAKFKNYILQPSIPLESPRRPRQVLVRWFL